MLEDILPDLMKVLRKGERVEAIMKSTGVREVQEPESGSGMIWEGDKEAVL